MYQAQALGGILQEPESVDTLIKAWESLDFDAILNQSALVTGCLQDTIQSYFDTFYAVLKEAKIGTDGSIDQQEQQSSGSIHRFLLFADDILERYVSDSAELSTRLNGSGSSISESKYQQADESFLQSTLKVDERAFLMKWSYLTGQILRELTITSSPAFGTFQIMCLFLE